MPERPLAVFDIGSNSGRAIVVRLAAGQHIEILSDARASLRLVTEVDREGRLSPAAAERTVAAVQDFLAIAAGSGSRRVVAVATAAVREASNRRDFVDTIARQTGVSLRVLEGDEEAHYAFWGAVHGLPVENGLLVDVGGGSLEITQFARRKALAGWTLPLGALRLTGRFLLSDPPRPQEIAELVAHARSELAGTEVPALGPDDRLVGTGGTIRNLAKVHRARRRVYPIPRLHGYTMSRRDVADLAARLSVRRTARRATIAGLSTDRADSIVGGAFAVQTVMEGIGAGSVVVSGQGLREGIAYEAFHDSLPASRSVRRTAIDALTARFSTWTPTRARRRVQIAHSVLDGLSDEVPDHGREMLGHSGWMLDIGRSIDFYERWEHTATIVASGDLQGFSHRDIAMVAAIIREAGGHLPSLRVYASLLDTTDRRFVERAGVILALADEIERRLPAGATGQASVTMRRRSVIVSAQLAHPWPAGEVGQRFQRVMHRSLVVEASPR